MVQTTKTQSSDTLRGVALPTPFATRERHSLPKSATNTGWRAFCRLRWKASTGRSNA
jgi:hypothetical protein